MSIYLALAYLDPGTGSMVLQMVIGGLLGGLLVIKLMWRRIVGFCTGRKPDSGEPSKSDEVPPSDHGSK